MTELLSESSEVVSGLSLVLTAGGMILYLMQCFLGYRFVRGWMALAGFAAGFIIGLFVGMGMEHESAVFPFGVGLLCGIILAFLSYRIYLMGIFILCGILAAAFVLDLPWPEGGTWQLISLGAAGFSLLASGILAIRFTRTFVILITGVMGSANAVSQASRLFPSLLRGTGRNMLVFLILALAGILIQFLTTDDE